MTLFQIAIGDLLVGNAWDCEPTNTDSLQVFYCDKDSTLETFVVVYPDFASVHIKDKLIGEHVYSFIDAEQLLRDHGLIF